MMNKKVFIFGTKKEAVAFVEGINFVNDSAIEVVSIKKNKNGWIVTLIDEEQ